MVTHTIRNNKWDNIKSNSYRKGTTATETALFHHKSLCPALTPTGDFLAPQLASNPNVLSQLYVVKSPGLQELWTHTHTHTRMHALRLWLLLSPMILEDRPWSLGFDMNFLQEAFVPFTWAWCFLMVPYSCLYHNAYPLTWNLLLSYLTTRFFQRFFFIVQALA